MHQYFALPCFIASGLLLITAFWMMHRANIESNEVANVLSEAQAHLATLTSGLQEAASSVAEAQAYVDYLEAELLEKRQCYGGPLREDIGGLEKPKKLCWKCREVLRRKMDREEGKTKRQRLSPPEDVKDSQS